MLICFPSPFESIKNGDGGKWNGKLREKERKAAGS
jgi:hypothetical protein